MGAGRKRDRTALAGAQGEAGLAAQPIAAAAKTDEGVVVEDHLIGLHGSIGLFGRRSHEVGHCAGEAVRQLAVDVALKADIAENRQSRACGMNDIAAQVEDLGRSVAPQIAGILGISRERGGGAFRPPLVHPKARQPAEGRTFAIEAERRVRRCADAGRHIQIGSGFTESGSRQRQASYAGGQADAVAKYADHGTTNVSPLTISGISSLPNRDVSPRKTLTIRTGMTRN